MLSILTVANASMISSRNVAQQWRLLWSPIPSLGQGGMFCGIFCGILQASYGTTSEILSFRLNIYKSKYYWYTTLWVASVPVVPQLSHPTRTNTTK